MTTANRFSDRNRDIQDGFERHVWGKQEYVDGAGSIIRLRGTGTEEQEAVVVNVGMGFNLAENSNTEVFTLSGGSDTTMKFALATIPRDKQRQWAEGTGGIQNPTDPERALEFNDKRAHMLDKLAVLAGVLEVVDGQVYIRGNLAVDGDIGVTGSSSVQGARIGSLPSGAATVTVPEFEQ